MPILVKDYSWSETDTHVSLTVPLRGVKPSRADIFSSDAYIKVNFPPYLFEAHLFRLVIEEQCTAKVGNGAILFELVKRERSMWGQLVSEKGSKEEMMATRQEAVEHSHQRSREEKEAKAKKKREEEQFAIKQQMKLEQDDRERIEKEKQEERDKATSELESWKKQPSNTQSLNRDVWTGKEQRAPPPPRNKGEITVRFTPRPFSNAARESKAQEEQEWLAKMAAARKIKQTGDSKESINERNPEFLKDKGNEFFKTGNYQAAINAYTQALKLNHLLPSLYSNRAACYLSTGNYEACVHDCCRALELYYPIVPSNIQSRAKVLVRRGTAYAKLEEYELALQDYDAAMKLAPEDSSLKQDYDNLTQHTLNV